MPITPNLTIYACLQAIPLSYKYALCTKAATNRVQIPSNALKDIVAFVIALDKAKDPANSNNIYICSLLSRYMY